MNQAFHVTSVAPDRNRTTSDDMPEQPCSTERVWALTVGATMRTMACTRSRGSANRPTDSRIQPRMDTLHHCNRDGASSCLNFACTPRCEFPPLAHGPIRVARGDPIPRS
jgi:hypothetical protein